MKGGVDMIVTIDLFDAIVLAVLGVLLLICGIILAIEAIKSRRRK